MPPTRGVHRHQNVYEDFRRAFCTGTLLPSHGQFHPLALAEVLVGRGPAFEDWRLDQTRVYLGRPSRDRSPRGAGAHDRQTQGWRDKGVIVRARPLQYLAGRARQKGVDVELAVDVVRTAVGRTYEIGTVVSTDTDMLPAIEAVDSLRGSERWPRTCVVSYTGLSKVLQLPDGARQPYAFRPRRADYEAVRDSAVYVSPEDGPVSD